MCKTLIVDNFDSFTYNLYQYMGEVCGREPTVVLNTVPRASLDLDDYDCIIISPGPGTPARAQDVGLSVALIKEAQVPVLGVCLGHQCMAHVHDMDIVHAPEPVHGRVSAIQHDNDGVFKGLPQNLRVVRYHSLVVKQVKPPFKLTAWGADGIVHGIRHTERPLHGVQFHPESVYTAAGLDLLRNFRDIAVTHKQQAALNA
ncbi:anthranilate synthase component II [Caldimonas brevitalea]|uniref:Para-aminobenzoate synthase, amidotransferase component n=1 Tax=Caldimonas brevitalea TaxID=413882 RepID=A0A0G3BL01_9BURK|nr:aminodeoxychorismate/anthranilate synthase component II [Caldimonas brevitalea]AKJ30077.1 para-aminobenzoate synthase, amidotransferase component [Caldimonas brevitalea]